MSLLCFMNKNNKIWVKEWRIVYVVIKYKGASLNRGDNKIEEI